jgi:hypothetical protein
VYFSLAQLPDTSQPMKLELLDASGRVLRTYGRATAATAAAAAALPAGGPGAATRATLKPVVGLNAFQWDLRADPPTALPGNINIWGTTGGYRVSPGRYQARLTVGSAAQTQGFEVREDPRVTIAPAELAARDSLARGINVRVGEIHDALLRLRDVREQVSKFVDRTKDAPNAPAIAAKGKEIVAKAEALEPQLSTKAANGQDVINYRNGINAQYAFLLGNVEGSDIVSQPSRERKAELDRLWSALRAQVDAVVQQDVPAFNALLQAGQVNGVIVPGATPKVVM